MTVVQQLQRLKGLVEQLLCQFGNIANPVDGKSAYEIALDNNFVGTEAEWIESLAGETGKSAYELAVQLGQPNTGSLVEWLDSLHGEDGTNAQSFKFKGNVSTYSDLPTTGNTINDAYYNETDQLTYVYNGISFPTNGKGITFKGSNSIIRFSDSTFPLVATTPPIQRLHDNSIWQLADGQTADIGDVPRVSNKWIQITPKKLEVDRRIPTISKNLFNKDTAKLGYLVNVDNGNLDVNSAWFAGDFIEINPSLPYINLGFYAFYDSSFNFVRGGVNADSAEIGGVGTKYLRVSYPLTDIDTYQVEQSTVKTGYQNFYAIPESYIIKENAEFTTTQYVVRAGGNVGVNCDFTDIKSAYTAITDNSKTNRYRLICIGVFDISGSSDKYLGFKNYVDIIGQYKGSTIIINRKTTFINDAACFDPEYYNEAIEYCLIKNVTCISFNGKSPIHVDCGYSKLKSGGTIEVVNCDLINENTSSMVHYQNGLACGLLDGQRVIARNVNSNGQLWCHTNSKLSRLTGSAFELYNCRFPKTMIADLHTYGHDKFIMKGCKMLFIDFNISGSASENYLDYSWDVDLSGNEIGYMIGTKDSGTDRFATWDEVNNGKWGICDSSIHMYCKNNTASPITRGTLVSISSPANEISIKPKTGSEKLYGQTLDNIPAGGYGVVQYAGVLFIDSIGAFSVGDYVKLDLNNKAILGNASDNIGISIDSASGNSNIRVTIN